FGNIVIQGFGFSTINTPLLQVPNSVLSIILIIASPYISQRVPNCRCYLIAAFMALGILGACLIRELPAHYHVGRLFGRYLFSTIACAFPLALSLIDSNVCGQTKKIFVNGVFFVTYCAGNIAGPQVFLESEAPGYPTAFVTMLGCVAASFVLVVLYRAILRRENKRRDTLYRPVSEAATAGNDIQEAGAAADGLGRRNLTDSQLERTFRRGWLVPSTVKNGPSILGWKGCDISGRAVQV
ncbi:hypothetical protein BJX64DRAFT_294740, partial [Aspergillus heterothallicus]